MDIFKTNVGNRIMNTYVYRAPGGFVMIDTGYENSLKSVEKKLASNKISFSEIKYVFLTHAHDDHAGFLNEVLEKYSNVQVIVNPDSIPILKKGQNSFDGGCSSQIAYLFTKGMSLTGKGEHRFPPVKEKYFERLIQIKPENKQQLENELGGKILFTPGHTKDSISLTIGREVFCGDAAMNGFPSMHRITIWLENKEEFQKSWELLLNENGEILMPAHGNPFPKSDLKKYINKISKISLRKP